MSHSELTNYSSFCQFEQEAIESALKEAGINYRIEAFSMPVPKSNREIDCFNLHIAEKDIPKVFDLVRDIELRLCKHYRQQFNDSFLGLRKIQELIQYGQQKSC